MVPRIGFDASPLARPVPPGVRRAVAGALEALERRAVLEVVRLAPEPGDATPLGRWRRRALGRAARAAGCAGLHSFLSALPPGGGLPRVQTVHELPWRHGVREGSDLAHRAWAALGPLLAARVAVPSELVARDLARAVLARASRVRIVPWGVGPPFAPEEPPGVVDELALERHRLGSGPFALALGAVRAKKGLGALLHGVARLVARGAEPVQVVVTGPDTPDLRRDLGLAARLGLSRWVTTLGVVDERDLSSLVRLAACVCVLSRSEGFGFPALEAAACGTPAVVARGGAPAELLGPAALEADPADPDAVADLLLRARAERSALRPALLARAARCSWDACAERIEALWQEIL